MFGHIPLVKLRQNRIITNFNLFIDVAKENGIEMPLYKLSETGTCQGLTYAYEIYDHQEQGEDYILSLMFIALLQSKEQIIDLFQQYQSAKKAGKRFTIPIKGYAGEYNIEFSKILTMLTGAHFSQKNSSMQEIGALWDKSYTILCPLNELAKNLKQMNMQNGQTVFMHLGTHVFRIKKEKQGYYFFEPNYLNYALNPLEDEDALANSILKHYKSQLKSSHFVCSAQFISYANQTNPVLENAMQKLGQDVLAMYPAIKHLYDEYGQRKISRLDCALAILQVIPLDKNTEIFDDLMDTIFNYIFMENNQLKLNANLINVRPYHGVTVLFLVARWNQIDVLRQLLTYPEIQVNQGKDDSITPLYIAACCGNRQIVELLLNHPNIQVNKASDLNATPLFIAAQQGHLDIVELLLSRPDIQINLARNDDSSPLFIAAQQGRFKVVELLLSRPDIQINQCRDDGSTPLFVAVYQQHSHIAELLLKHPDIQVNQAIYKGSTTLFIAAQKGQSRIVKLLLNREDIQVNQANNDGSTPLFIAAHKGLSDIVQLLLNHDDIQVNQQRKDGITPLFIAAEQGNVNIAQLLLEDPDIQVNLANKKGITPLFVAVERGHFKIVELLLSHPNIQINQKKNDGATPLFIAAHLGHSDIVELLLKHADIQVNPTMKNGATPLFIAAQKGHTHIVELLLNQDIEVNQPINAKTHILIRHARKQGFEQPLRALIKKHHSLFPNKLSGFSPLHAAIFFGHDDIAKSLLAANADSEALTGGISCLELAEVMGRSDIVKILTCLHGKSLCL